MLCRSCLRAANRRKPDSSPCSASLAEAKQKRTASRQSKSSFRSAESGTQRRSRLTVLLFPLSHFGCAGSPGLIVMWLY